MAAKIRGITVEIGGDTSGLQKALKNTNSEINSTQKQLKDVEKLLKLDPGSVELLEQKQKLLNDAVEQTSEKLDVLRQAEEQLKESGIDENSEQFMALRREILSTEQSLAKAKTEADGFSVALQSAAAQADKVASAAGNVADKTKGLSTAAAGVVAGLTGAALSAAAEADNLNTLSKQTGISTDDLQKYQYASEMVDVSQEAIVSSLAKLKKNMSSTSSTVTDAFNQLGVSVTNTDGTMRSATDVFDETLVALSQIENETERDTLAMSIFGKGADQLAGIIDDGGASLKAYGDQAEEMGLILSGDTLNSLNSINDQIDTVKATASATLLGVGAEAAEALLPVITDIVNGIAEVLKWVGSLDSDTLKLILTVAAMVASISPIAGIIGQISGAVSGFLSFLPALQSGFGSITAFVASNPWTLVAAGVVALVSLIVSNWDTVKGVLSNIREKTPEAFQTIKDTITSIVTSIVETIKNKINAVIGVINGLIKGVNSSINGLNKFKIEAPDWVPGIGGKSYGINIPNVPEIPMLANGGVLSSGSAIVGEAGAELLTVGSGTAKVQPLTNNNTTNVYNQTSMNPIQVNVQLDKQTIARAVYQPLKQMAADKGMSAVY